MIKYHLLIEKGDKGDTGPTGATGNNGLSVYDIAQQNGFVGTIEDFISQHLTPIPSVFPHPNQVVLTRNIDTIVVNPMGVQFASFITDNNHFVLEYKYTNKIKWVVLGKCPTGLIVLQIVNDGNIGRILVIDNNGNCDLVDLLPNRVVNESIPECESVRIVSDSNTVRVEYFKSGYYNIFVEIQKSSLGVVFESGCVGCLTSNGGTYTLVNNSIYKQQVTQLSQLKVLLLGDSITEQYAQGYATLLNKKTGANVIPQGYSGQGFGNCNAGKLTSNNVINNVKSANPDVLVIYAGTNDYWHNVELGAINSSNLDETTGGLRYLVSTLQAWKPSLVVVLCTPHYQNYNKDSNLANSKGYSLKDYVKRIADVANDFNIPCLDTNKLLNINALNYTHHLTDGVHFKTVSYDRLTSVQSGFLKSLIG